MENPSKFYSQEQAEEEARNQVRELKSLYPEQEGVFTSEQYEEADINLREKQIEFIKDIAGQDSPAYLFGGYASDLLIHGDTPLKEPHKDVDMVILRNKEGELVEKLKGKGYQVKAKIESGMKKPLKLDLKNAGSLKGDFVFADIEESTGQPYIETKAKDGKSIRLYFSADIFQSKPIQLGDRLIKVISPRSLIQSLLFYNQREKDLMRVEKLIEKYFPSEKIDSELFKVKTEEIDTK